MNGSRSSSHMKRSSRCFSRPRFCSQAHLPARECETRRHVVPREEPAMPTSFPRRIAAGLLGFTVGSASAGSPGPQATHFPSADGRTELVGYLFEPSGPGPHPAVVMLHGRAGPNSSNVNAGCTLVAPGRESPCNASTLSRRHAMWGEYWAAHGYVALLVDSFGPRGRGHGYGRFTH